MNRLLSGERREVIIYKIIEDGIYRQRIAEKALSDYLLTEKDEAVMEYYDTMDSNEDALEDAYRQALQCTDPNMQQVCRFLDEYLQLAIQILDDTIDCKLTNEMLEKITRDAGHALEQAKEYSSRCIADLHMIP